MDRFISTFVCMALNENEVTKLIKLIECEDGSHTLYREDLNEHYHSVYGAISESQHIFIDAGFNYMSQKLSEINILEVGFGTGLNACMTQLDAEKERIKTNYFAVEPIKLTQIIFSKLNYKKILGSDKFERIYKSPWNQWNGISNYFSIFKVDSKIEDTGLPANNFNLVYFDAFAPDVQSELWTETIFMKIFESMKKDAVLLTYSCKGDVKRALIINWI